jgi:ABC-2 type transport system permease protein
MQMKNYAVYYFTGSLIFNYMSEATNGSLYSILWASGLIKKVYIPKYIFPLEKCLFGLVNCFFSLIVVLILMPILGVPLNVYDFLVFIPILYTLVFSYGLGLILAAVEVFFRDIGHLYSVWITAWLYLTPILYPVDMLPKNISSWIYYNPMYYYIKYFRQLTMDAQLPTLTDNLQCAAIAVSFLIVGLLVFKKMQDRFILYI